MRGLPDPGSTHLSTRGFSLSGGGAAEAAVDFAQFAHWAAPLTAHLQRVREQVQSAFLAAAYAGAGLRDYEKAFRRIDTNGDGVLSTQEFIAAIGPIARHLEPPEISALIEHFDSDGSGNMDYRKFLALFAPEEAKHAEVTEAERGPYIENGEWKNLPEREDE